MIFKVMEDYVSFQLQKKELTPDIQSILSIAQAKIIEQKNTVNAQLQHQQIAGLNIHQIKRLGLPPVYPCRLKVETQGRPSTSAFTYEIQYLDEKSRRFYQVQRKGVVLKLDDRSFTLTNPHFQFLENLEKISSDIKSPGERLKLWSQVIKTVPEEIALSKPQLLNFQFIKADHFCIDKKKTSYNEFKIVPELVYKAEASGDENAVSSQLPQGISQEFKDQFLDINSIDPYYKMGNYYMQISQPLRECFRVIKKINKEPIEKRMAFYSNPMERIKKELPEDISEDLLEDIFFETEQFKSDRISRLGKWVPKIGIYIDPDDKNPWFPKDEIAIKIENSLFHFHPDKLDTVIESLEQEKQKGEDQLVYDHQIIPVTDHTISQIKEVRDKIIKNTEQIKSSSQNAKEQKESLSKQVAIIKDNLDKKKYEKARSKRLSLKIKKGIPSSLADKFAKYPHQKKGLLWLQERFIQGVPGSLLADDMGLGKTFQTLAFLHWYRQNIKKTKPILIVAPTGLLKNWQDEHEEHLYKPGVGLGRLYKAYGQSFRKDRKNSDLSVIKEMRKSDWVLATYESIRDHHTDYFIRVSFGVVIFDEIQKIKSPNALMTDASKALDSDFSIGLTGTPIENSLIDIWCISDCLYPKILGLLKDFHKKYIKKKNEHSGKELQNTLLGKTPPFLLRRMKKDILKDLPKREFITKKVEMTNEQQDVYTEVLRKVKSKEYAHTLQAISLLKRYSIYLQDCFEGKDKEFIQSSAKLKLLFEFLEGIQAKNEKALICIENRNLQKKIKGICEARWNLQEVYIINGEMDGQQRKTTIDCFGETKGFNILILSPRAGGVGLNIVSANHIIHLERWWNPAIEDQCNDRIFRIGQIRPVYVYYPLVIHPAHKEESFDVILHKLLEKKKQISADTLIPSEPSQYEKDEFCRMITQEEPYNSYKEGFYESEQWKTLRNQALQQYGCQCLRCGNKNHIEVDHVKPRCKYPQLELDIHNLQILCRDCNNLKGSKDSSEWDFRKKQ